MGLGPTWRPRERVPGRRAGWVTGMAKRYLYAEWPERKPLPKGITLFSQAEMVRRIDQIRLDEADVRCPTCGTDVPHVKWCWACRRTLSVTAFNRSRNRPDGRMTDCKTCQAAREKRRASRKALEAIRRSA